jgi:surfactin synthase thioesterase subunit
MPKSNLVSWPPDTAAESVVLCFPAAGMGAGQFRRWNTSVPERTELVGVRLPGRETRLREQPIVDLATAVSSIVDEWIEADRREPACFVGVCSGAILAFEVMRELRRRGHELPAHFVSVAQSGPSTQLHGQPEMAGDRDVWARVGAVSGPDAVPSPESPLRRLLAPVVAADFEMIDRYEYTTGQPFALDATVITSTLDHADSPDDLWDVEFTSPPQRFHLVGDHLLSGNSWVRLGELVGRLTRTD